MRSGNKWHRTGLELKNKQVQCFRIKAWYWSVKSRCSWTNYQLDLAFDEECTSGKRNGMDRHRIFERAVEGKISKNLLFPVRGPHLIQRVETHPLFKGTSEVYDSILWRLLDTTSFDIHEIANIVSDCFQALELVRPSDFIIQMLIAGMEKVDSGRSKYFADEEWKEYYLILAAARRIVILKGANLNTLALIGALFREAHLACALRTALAYERIFLELLQEVCSQSWLATISDDLLRFIEEQVLFWNVPTSRFSGAESDSALHPLYDDWEPVVVRRPVFPKTGEIEYLLEKENEIWESYCTQFKKK